MPEGFGTGEVAHHLGHDHGHDGGKRGWSEQTIEILEAFLLAIVAVATAWSGYQAARLDGRQAHLYGLSSKYRLLGHPARDARRPGADLRHDARSTSGSSPTTIGDAKAAALFVKRFRPEYRPAFAAWMTTDPFHNPKAPAGPIVMPQYHNANLEASAKWEERASAAFEDGHRGPRDRGQVPAQHGPARDGPLPDRAGAAVQGAQRPLGLIGVSGVLLVIALYFVLTYPTA